MAHGLPSVRACDGWSWTTAQASPPSTGRDPVGPAQSGKMAQASHHFSAHADLLREVAGVESRRNHGQRANEPRPGPQRLHLRSFHLSLLPRKRVSRLRVYGAARRFAVGQQQNMSMKTVVLLFINRKSLEMNDALENTDGDAANVQRDGCGIAAQGALPLTRAAASVAD
jgi:hypothetical protein